MNYTTYYNEIRSDIAKEFGLEAGGFAPTPKPALSIRQAQYLANKYPLSNDDLELGLSPRAVYIAKRYGSLSRMWAKSQTR